MTAKINKVSRNHGLDLLRGICILGVIWHHTCMYSGGDFVPDFMKQLSFLLEAPALFFVSGLTYKYVNRDILIGNLMKLAFSFTLIALILNSLFGVVTLPSVFEPLLNLGLHVPTLFYVLDSSYWFVPVYALVLIAATIILKKMHNIYPLIMAVCLGMYVIPDSLFSISSLSICFLHTWGPGIFFLLGFFLFGYWYLDCEKLYKYRYQLALIVLLAGVFLYSLCYIQYGTNVLDLEYYKTLKSLPYISASFLSIAFLIAIYTPELKNRFIERIGSCSIFYYIAQGISSSFLLFIEPHISICWPIKLVLLFIVNLLFAAVCAEIYIKIYTGIGILCRKIIK